MFHTALRIFASSLAAAALFWPAPAARNFEPTRVTSDRSSADYAQALAEARSRFFGAHVVHIDPATGERLQSPPQGFTALPPVQLPRTALVQEALPGGGTRVRLHGNFRAASTAHVDGNGHVHTACREDN